MLFLQIDPESRPTCHDLRSSFKQTLDTLKPKIIVKKLPIFISNSPNAIGEEMSKLDPHYIPSPAQGVNPFLPLFGHNGKILANCFSCVEFNTINWQQQRPKYRKTVSLVGPTPNLDGLWKMHIKYLIFNFENTFRFNETFSFYVPVLNTYSFSHTYRQHR